MLTILVSLTLGRWVLAIPVVRDISAPSALSATLSVNCVEGAATSAKCARMESNDNRILHRLQKIVRWFWQLMRVLVLLHMLDQMVQSYLPFLLSLI